MITKEDAIAGGEFYHVTLRNADGSALRCRSNGKCKTWKRNPERFRLPVKYGCRAYLYITSENAKDWLLEDPTAWKRTRKRVIKQHKLAEDIPDGILRDFMQDKGITCP
jgi:hypothetical protein